VKDIRTMKKINSGTLNDANRLVGQYLTIIRWSG